MKVEVNTTARVVIENKGDLLFLRNLTQNYLGDDTESSRHSARRKALFEAATKALAALETNEEKTYDNVSIREL